MLDSTSSYWRDTEAQQKLLIRQSWNARHWKVEEGVHEVTKIAPVWQNCSASSLSSVSSSLSDPICLTKRGKLQRSLLDRKDGIVNTKGDKNNFCQREKNKTRLEESISDEIKTTHVYGFPTEPGSAEDAHNCGKPRIKDKTASASKRRTRGRLLQNNQSRTSVSHDEVINDEAFQTNGIGFIETEREEAALLAIVARARNTVMQNFQHENVFDCAETSDPTADKFSGIDLTADNPSENYESQSIEDHYVEFPRVSPTKQTERPGKILGSSNPSH